MKLNDDGERSQSKGKNHSKFAAVVQFGNTGHVKVNPLFAW